MRKQRISVLVIITVVFAAFTLGYLFGRNNAGGEVIVSVSEAMQTAPTYTPVDTQPTQETAPAIVFPININTADKEEFMALPGIGEVLAERILTWREEHGQFTVVEDLLNVEGIGEKRFEEILDLITIGG